MCHRRNNSAPAVSVRPVNPDQPRPPRLSLDVELVPEQTTDDTAQGEDEGRTRDDYLRDRPPHHTDH